MLYGVVLVVSQAPSVPHVSFEVIFRNNRARRKITSNRVLKKPHEVIFVLVLKGLFLGSFLLSLSRATGSATTGLTS